MLVHRDKMQTLLGTYAVGDATCLVDPSLVTLAQDYRRRAQARLQPLDAEGLKKLPAGDYHVSLKIDGEFNLLVYQDSEAILVNPGGTVRAGLPCLEEIASLLDHPEAPSPLVLAGELYYVHECRQRERVHDVLRVARAPQSADELDWLCFTVFDVVGARSFESALLTIHGYGLPRPPWVMTRDRDEIGRYFQKWTEAGGEGLVLRSEQGSYKVKLRHSIDAVVVGFTEAAGDRAGMIHDLLLALLRPDGSYQLIGRVGGGFTDQDRRDWLCDLQDWQVSSTHAETNEGLAYRWVWPRHVIEISVLDVISQTMRSQPILTECLEWQTSEGHEEKRPGLGMWHAIRKLPGVALISPQFVRRRDDKFPVGSDIRLGQVADLIDIPLADLDPRKFDLAKSQVLRRTVWTKKLKGQEMVRKLVLWQTNKAIPLVPGALPDWPAYVIACTDYSPGRAEPLQRDLRASDSREQIEKLWTELEAEKIVQGWQRTAETEHESSALQPKCLVN
jgi:hypothetical protein